MVGDQAPAALSEDSATAQTIGSENASSGVATAFGANTKLRFAFQENKKQPFVELLATALMLISSGCWLMVFATCKVAALTAPWCVVLLSSSLISLVQVIRRPKQESLTLITFGNLEPTTLRQTTALSFAIFSLSMCLWMVLHRDIEFKRPLEATRQIIDIELVSKADYEDNQDFLPSTEKKETVKERSSTAEITQQSPLPLIAKKVSATPKTVPVSHTTHAPAPLENKLPQAKTAKLTATPDIFPIKISEAPRSAVIPAKPQSQPTHIAPQQPMLEEVAPVELVEMTENSGDKGNETFQTGGRSAGGTGAPAPISAYLKELHKRIKHAWTPPNGETRSAEVLFRIKRNGTLASIKIVQSSGNEDSDESAMRAIAACSPFKALPPDYSAPYLDLQYTFNYRVDSLSEVNGRQM